MQDTQMIPFVRFLELTQAPFFLWKHFPRLSSQFSQFYQAFLLVNLLPCLYPLTFRQLAMLLRQQHPILCFITWHRPRTILRWQRLSTIHFFIFVPLTHTTQLLPYTREIQDPSDSIGQPTWHGCQSQAFSAAQSAYEEHCQDSSSFHF